MFVSVYKSALKKHVREILLCSEVGFYLCNTPPCARLNMLSACGFKFFLMPRRDGPLALHVSCPPPACATTPGPPLRLCMSATVVKGFGRGSKLLGIPTANMDMSEVGRIVNNTSTGIYFGYAMLRSTIYPTVVSVGWNPYFDNREKTVVSFCSVLFLC